MLQGQDLASGNLTAPVLFALQSNCGSELLDLIDSEFVEEGDLERAIELVKAGGGVAAAKQLACEEADKVCPSSCLSRTYDCLTLHYKTCCQGLFFKHVALTCDTYASCQGTGCVLSL